MSLTNMSKFLKITSYSLTLINNLFRRTSEILMKQICFHGMRRRMFKLHVCHFAHKETLLNTTAEATNLVSNVSATFINTLCNLNFQNCQQTRIQCECKRLFTSAMLTIKKSPCKSPTTRIVDPTWFTMS